MTAKEMIDALSQFPPDERVSVICRGVLDDWGVVIHKDEGEEIGVVTITANVRIYIGRGATGKLVIQGEA